MTQADRGGPQRGRVMPVVDIEETYSTGHRSFLTGWVVTSWDGYHETSVCIPAHKGEPMDVIDEEANADWRRHNWAMAESRMWASRVWQLARKTDWPFGDDDLCTVQVRVGEGVATTIFRRTVAADVTSYRFTDRCFITSPTMTGRPELHHSVVAKHRRRAILAESKDEFLWELVFAWPEQEWVARWGIFLDALREGRWGDEWARVGECMVASGWTPKHPPRDELVFEALVQEPV